MHILGVLLPENQLAKHALTAFFGIGPATAQRICARMLIHDRAKIRDLTQHHQTTLTAFLSSPSTFPDAPRLPLASPRFKAPSPSKPLLPVSARVQTKEDTLKGLKIEAELRKEIRENIGHQRMIGSYVGKRHAAHLPVRGQNTQSNAKTARKLNRVDRKV